MSIARKAAAILEGITPDDLQQLPPAERRRFADRCKYLAALAAAADRPAPKAGVLARLSDGERVP